MFTLFLALFVGLAALMIPVVLLQPAPTPGLSPSQGAGRGVQGALARLTGVTGGLWMLLALLIPLVR